MNGRASALTTLMCAMLFLVLVGCASTLPPTDQASRPRINHMATVLASLRSNSRINPAPHTPGVGPRLVPVDAHTSSGSVPVGPGPTNYTVQPQPSAGSCHVRWTAQHQPLPDPKCTPGATNPKVTLATVKSTICRSGYTKTIRPPEKITSAEKRASMRAYGETSSRATEYDHLVPLELGGDPNDSRNLWPEPPSPGQQSVNNPKDKVESALNDLVCSGTVPLATAQHAIATNWTTALATVGHPDGN